MTENEEPGELLQTADVALLAQRTGEGVRQAVRCGLLKPAFVTSLGQRLFTRDEVMRWISTLQPRTTRRVIA